MTDLSWLDAIEARQRNHGGVTATDVARLVKTLRRVSALIPEWVVDLAEDQTWYAGPNVSVSEAQELPAVIAVRKAYIGALRAALAGEGS